jgi:RNA recognition motif-containing protein
VARTNLFSRDAFRGELMNTKIQVANLAVATTESELTALFAPYGNVVSASVAVDRTRNEPRGFGFVTMVTPEGAQAAIQALNGKAFGANTLAASEVRKGKLHR